MNLANLTLLKNTLLNLPPEIHFDMREGRTEHPCGTAACIAGLAHILANPEATPQRFFGWYGVKRQALIWLGFPEDPDDNGFGHALFSPRLAPEDCTPQQAAQAVQNVMDNQSPWN